MKSNFFILVSVLLTGIFSVVAISNIGGAYVVHSDYGAQSWISGDYGSSKGHMYFYETGNSGLTGEPDFIVTKGLGSVPICFDTYKDYITTVSHRTPKAGGFRTVTTPSVTWDYVSCYVVPPEDYFGRDRGDLPVHCFLRTPYRMMQGLPHPAVCDLEGKPIRYEDEEGTMAIYKGLPKDYVNEDFINTEAPSLEDV